MSRKLWNMLAIVIVVSTIIMAYPLKVKAYEKIEKKSEVCSRQYVSTDGDEHQSYSYSKGVVRSYLFEENNKYLRIQGEDKGVLVEYFDKDYNLISSKSILIGQDYFGGVHISKNNNYIVTGSKSSGYTNGFKIIKFDKNWNMVDSVNAFSGRPFENGTCRTSECNGYLYVSSNVYDGGYRQQSVTIKVNMANMNVERVYHEEGNSFGFVMNTVNQFIDTDGKSVYAVYQRMSTNPRAIVLYEDCDKDRKSEWVLMELDDEVKSTSNYMTPETKTCIGGFAVTDSSYIVVGRKNPKPGSQGAKGHDREVFLTVMSKSTRKVTTKILSDYSEYQPTNPYLLKISNDKYMVIWGKNWGETCCAIINSEGVLLDGIKECESDWLTACKPLVANGKIIWYSCNGKIIKFHEISMSDYSFKTVVVDMEHNYKLTKMSDGYSWVECNSCHDIKKYKTPTSLETRFERSEEEKKLCHGDGLPLYEHMLSHDATVGENRKYKIDSDAEGDASSSMFQYVKVSDLDIVQDNHNFLSFLRPGVVEITIGNILNPSLEKTYRFTVLAMNAEKTEQDDTAIREFVNRQYQILLDRDAEPSGLDDWTNRLASGSANAAQIVEGIVNSQEFANKNLSNADVVERMYQSMLGRASDPDGKSGWTTKLNSGLSANSIINGFSGSAEFGALCANYGISAGSITLSEPRDQNEGISAFVARCYEKALGRAFEKDGLNYWCTNILNDANKKQKAEEVASNGFFHSQEFANKNTSNDEYVEILYRTFLGREYDVAGKADWVGKLNSGVSRDDVLYGFSRSQEFANIMDQYGL